MICAHAVHCLWVQDAEAASKDELIEQLQALVAPVLQRYSRRLAYGSSLGAYAVLYYCAHGYDMVISSSPRVSAHPEHGIPHWQRQVRFLHERFAAQPPATSPAVVFYDPKDAQDRRFVEHEVQPSWPHAQYVRIPYAGHPSNQFLAEIGYITHCIRALIQGQPLPPLDRSAKGRSGMYHQVLAHACMERGKLRWALALGERAMQLSPYLDLGRRTLAEIGAWSRMSDAEKLAVWGQIEHRNVPA